MSTQSLDDVLAGVDASDQELTNETAGNEVEVSQEAEAEEQDQGDEGDQGHDAHGALHAERQRVKRKYTETVADFERKLGEANTGFEKKLTDALSQNDQKWEQRFNQFAQQFQRQPQREEPKPEPITPDKFLEDFYGNPVEVIGNGVKQHLDPVNQRLAKITETFSARMAIKEYGKESVQAAFSALDQAARAGDRDAGALAERLRTYQSDDPFEEMVQWHKRTSIVNEVGADPDAFIAKRLADPAFLAKHGLTKSAAPPAQRLATNDQTLPSLNRVTAAADDDDGDEEEDATVVFNTALRRGVRR